MIEPLLPVRDARRGGRPWRYERRLVINTILYVLRSGCQWRMVPVDLVPWWVAYRWFRVWSRDGTWQRVHDALRDRVRVAAGRDRSPSAGVIDAQSMRTAEGGAACGYDAGKRVRGRKRHLLVDTLGLVLAVTVTSASVQDRHAARQLLHRVRCHTPTLNLVWADGGYAPGRDVTLLHWAADQLNLTVQIVTRAEGMRGFQVLPRRWVVERTFAWLTRNRRLARDYERSTEHAEAMIQVAMIRLMAARLTGETYTPTSPIEHEAARRLAQDDNP